MTDQANDTTKSNPVNKIVGERFSLGIPRGAKTDTLKSNFHAKNILFYIEKSPNTNCVVYEAGIDENGQLLKDPKEAIKPYWIMFEKDPVAEEGLNLLERNTAYGHTVKENQQKPGHFILKIVSLPEYEIDVFVSKEDGKIHAQITENEEIFEIISIWVDVGSNWGLPKVNHVDVKLIKVSGTKTETKVGEIRMKRIQK